MNPKIVLFTALLLAVCLTQFASDIYAPALVAIANDFKTDVNMAQWSMSMYMAGAATSQLVYGPLSEGIGRKKTLLIGLVIMLAGCIVCLSASSINILILGRLIQGLGAGACASMWRSIFRDIFTGEELSKIVSYLGTIIFFILPAAPLVGSYLLVNYGWYANFVFMAIYTVVALMCIGYWLEETNKNYHIEKLKVSYVIQNYSRLLKSPIFMGITICTFLSYGAFFSWFVIGSVLLIKEVGISPVYFAWINFIGGAIACILGAQLNGKFVTKYGMSNMLRLGWSISLVAGASLLLGKYIFGLQTWSVMLPIILFYFGTTFIWPNAFAKAFTPFGDIAGYAGSLYGFMQIIGAAVVSAIVTCFPDNDQSVLAITILLCSSLAWIIYEIIVLRQVKK